MVPRDEGGTVTCERFAPPWLFCWHCAWDAPVPALRKPAVNRAMAQEAATPEIAPVSESGGLAFSTPRPSQTEPPLVEVPEESEEALPWTYPISREILDDEQDVLRLVNANNLLDKDYPGEDMLVDVTVRKANSNEMLARAVASEALQAMFDAADEDGLKLYLYSAYRNYRSQEVIHYNRVEAMGYDDGLVQVAGGSEHQTGLAFDVISYAWIGSRFNEDFADSPGRPVDGGKLHALWVYHPLSRRETGHYRHQIRALASALCGRGSGYLHDGEGPDAGRIYRGMAQRGI